MISEFLGIAGTLMFEDDTDDHPPKNLTTEEWNIFLKKSFRDEKVVLDLTSPEEKMTTILIKTYTVFDDARFLELGKNKKDFTFEEIRFIILYRMAIINLKHLDNRYYHDINLVSENIKHIKELFRSMLKEPVWLSCLESAYKKSKCKSTEREMADYQYRNLFRIIFNCFDILRDHDVYKSAFGKAEPKRINEVGKVKVKLGKVSSEVGEEVKMIIPLSDHLLSFFSFDNIKNYHSDYHSDCTENVQLVFPTFIGDPTEKGAATIKHAYLLGRYIEPFHCDHLSNYHGKMITTANHIVNSFNSGRAEWMKERKQNVLLLETFLNSFHLPSLSRKLARKSRQKRQKRQKLQQKSQEENKLRFLIPEINSIIANYCY
jgi:hypothetical protein